MQLVICSDIFGHTDALDLWCESVVPKDWQKLVISPYRSTTHFEIESLAYQAFQKHGGIEAYIARLRQRLSMQKTPSVVIGFSAGAAAIYNLLAKDWPHSVVSLTGFYPGQIRFFTDLKPTVPTRLIFPAKEPHFDVTDVIRQLDLHDNVSCELTAFEHGFMNPHSRAYTEVAKTHFSDQIKAQLALLA